MYNTGLACIFHAENHLKGDKMGSVGSGRGYRWPLVFSGHQDFESILQRAQSVFLQNLQQPAYESSRTCGRSQEDDRCAKPL